MKMLKNNLKKQRKQFNLLFVCKHNKFRSKFAEIYFKKINKNSSIKIKSAGIFPGHAPLSFLEKKICKEFSIKIKGKPKPITTKLFEWNDLIILITDDIPNPKKLFNYASYKNKVIVWKIKDSNGNSKKQIKELIEKIMKKVNQLENKLKKI